MQLVSPVYCFFLISLDTQSNEAQICSLEINNQITAIPISLWIKQNKARKTNTTNNLQYVSL